MKIKPVGTLTIVLALLAGASLRAQSPGTPPPPPPAYPYTGYPYTGSVITDTSPLVVDVSLPYAFNFNNVGVVGDFGGMWRNNFFGAEVSYYDAQPDHHDWYYYGGGYGGYDEDITTLNFAYRCYFPIPTPGFDPYGRNTGFYLGGAAGVGWADVHRGYFFPGYGPNYYNSGTAQFDANAVAGFQFNFNRLVGLKIGYRFVWLDNSHLFYTNQRLSSSAIEAGLAFHF